MVHLFGKFQIRGPYPPVNNYDQARLRIQPQRRSDQAFNG